MSQKLCTEWRLIGIGHHHRPKNCDAFIQFSNLSVIGNGTYIHLAKGSAKWPSRSDLPAKEGLPLRIHPLDHLTHAKLREGGCF